MRVGSLVECIGKFNKDRYIKLYPKMQSYEFPIKGRLYTVRAIDSFVGIRLEEIVNPMLLTEHGVRESGFIPSAFVEIQSPEEAKSIIEEFNTQIVDI